MSEVLKLPLEEPIRQTRMLPLNAPAESAEGQRVRWLLQLGDAQRRREAEQKALQATAQAVQKTLLSLQSSVNGRLDLVAQQVVELGLALAREIVGDALDRGLVDPTPTVVRCLRDCVHGADPKDLIVYLHPDDLAPVQDRIRRMPAVQLEFGLARFVADPALARGAVRAETGAGRLRYDPQQVFARLADAVRSSVAGGAP